MSGPATSGSANTAGDDSFDSRLKPVFEKIGEVSSLPDVAIRVIQIAEDPTSDAVDMVRAVESDPALAMRLIRTVNSSYYALRRKVADLDEAVTLLGLSEIRNLAMTAYVAPLFREAVDHSMYNRRRLWHHMVSVGMVARLVARACGKISPEEAYLAGLLHDVGYILMDQYLHNPFCRVVDAIVEDEPACRTERTVLGFDHAELGQYVSQRWGLPGYLSTAIGNHHNPSEYDGPHREVVCAVALSDFLCHSLKLTSLGVRCKLTGTDHALAVLELTQPRVASIVGRLEEAITSAAAVASIQLN